MAKARTYERGFPWFVFDMLHAVSPRTAPDYLIALLDGYKEPPQGFDGAGGRATTTSTSPATSSPCRKPLSDGQVEYPKGPDGQPAGARDRRRNTPGTSRLS